MRPASLLSFVLFACTLVHPALAADGETGKGGASAASLSVGPAVLQSGSAVRIEYRNPELAGKKVTVAIDNGQRRGTERTQVTIELDGSGQGSAVWTVPEWRAANFNAPAVVEVNCPIVR